MVAKGGKGNSTPSGGNKNTGGPGGSQGKGNRTPSGSGGQPNGQTSPNGNAGGEIEIQARPLNPVQTKEMLQDHRVKAKGNPSGIPFSGKGRGRGDGGGPSSGGRGVDVERAIIVWIRSQVQIRCPMPIEIMSENALNPADDPFQDEWIDESGCVHNVNAAAGGQNA